MHATRTVAVNFCRLAKLMFGEVAVEFNLRGQGYGKFGYTQRERAGERETEDTREKGEFKMTAEMICALISVCLFTQPTF